jgi:hypothetical protein
MEPAEPESTDPGHSDPVLCDHCLDDLSLDGLLAASNATQQKRNDGKTSVDLSNLDHTPHWERNKTPIGLRRPCETSRFPETESGWLSIGRHYERLYCFKDHERASSAGSGYERLLTPPSLPKLLVESCRFCARLAQLLRDTYRSCQWWDSAEEVLSIYIQYEWLERRREWWIRGEEEQEGKTPQHVEMPGMLQCLAVHVRHPDLSRDEIDIFEFDVEALPGTSFYPGSGLTISNENNAGNCRDWLRISKTPADMAGPISKRNIKFMKNCITECVKKHDNCRARLSNMRFVPSRLLDVSDGDLIRLLEHDEIQDVSDSNALQVRYATLSYCWGDQRQSGQLPMQTTQDNRKTHTEIGISLQSMPQTFQDAILVARKLRIPYLWIDALCIIQDSIKDWETESVKMCDIFAHSFVTISAAMTSSSHDTFLQRPPPNVLRLPFSSPSRPEMAGEYIIPLEGRYDSPETKDLSGSRWQSRSWVWQEEIMSMRQLIFGERMLQFRCNCGIRLEDGTTSNNARMVLDPKVDLSYFWLTAVRACSARAITFPEDRLGVMSGVAKSILETWRASGDDVQYLAGLWLRDGLGDFTEQLLWVCLKPKLSYGQLVEELEDKRTFCAPSWSWASRNTGIDHLFVTKKPAFSVVAHDLQAAYSDAMVAVKHGSSLTLRGRLLKTPVQPALGVFKSESTRWPNRWETASPTGGGRFQFWLDWVVTGGDAEEDARQSHLSLFITTLVSRGYDGYSAAGLLLLPSHADEPLYRRVGVFEHYGDSQWLKEAWTEDVIII